MVFTKTKMKRKRRVECVSPLLDDSPKRTKVHAQRKFAQGSNVNSPVITPVKEIERQQDLDLLPEPVELLPMKRPNTEDFLTFLCFRGTPILPPTLNFFNTASIVDTNGQVHEIKAESPKNGPIDTSVMAKTGSGSSEKPFIAFGVRKRADPIVISRQMDRKRRHALALQALRRKYQEQKMAKIRAVTISKLSEKTTTKGPLKSQSQSSSAANNAGASSRNEGTSRKTNASSSAGGSGATAPVNKSKNSNEKPAASKRVSKIIVNAKTKLKVKTTTTTMASNVKIITKPKMCLRSFRGRFVQKELPFSRTGAVKRKSLPVPSVVKKVVGANKTLKGAGGAKVPSSTSRRVTENVVKKKNEEDAVAAADCCYSSEDDEPLARTSKTVIPKIARKSAAIVPKKTLEMNFRMTRSKQFIANKKTSRRQQLKKLILTTPKTMVKPRTLRSQTLVKKPESPQKIKKQSAVVVSNKTIKSSKNSQDAPNLGKRKIDSEPAKAVIKDNLRKNSAEEKKLVKAVRSDETTKVDSGSSVKTEPPKKDLKADIADKRDLKVELCRNLDKDIVPKSPDLPAKDELKSPDQNTSSTTDKIPSKKDKSDRNSKIIEALKRREQERIKLVDRKKSPTASAHAEHVVNKTSSNKKQNVGKKLADKKEDASFPVKSASQSKTVADTAKKEVPQKSDSSTKNRQKSAVSGSASTSQRPTRKTKEAAAIYMEILSHKLVNESVIDDDNVSIDSFPELPNVKKTEQRENELKAKANKNSESEITENSEVKKDSVKQKAVKSISSQDSRKDSKLKTTDLVVMETKSLRSSDKKIADKKKSSAICDKSPDESVTQSKNDNELIENQSDSVDKVANFAENEHEDTEKNQKTLVVDKDVRSFGKETETVVEKDAKSTTKDLKLFRKDSKQLGKYAALIEKDPKSLPKDLKLLRKDSKQPEEGALMIETNDRSTGKIPIPVCSNPEDVEMKDDIVNENSGKLLKKDAKPVQKEVGKDAKPPENDAAVIIEKDAKSTAKICLPVVDSTSKLFGKDDTSNKNYTKLPKKSVEKDVGKDASLVEKDAKSSKVPLLVDSNSEASRKDDTSNKSYLELLRKCENDIRKYTRQLEKGASTIKKNTNKSTGKFSLSVDSNFKIGGNDDALDKNSHKLVTEDEKLVEKEVRKDVKQLERDASRIDTGAKSLGKCSLAIDSNPKIPKKDDSLNQNDCKLLKKFEKTMEKDVREDAKQLEKDASMIEKDLKSTGKRFLQLDSNPKAYKKDDTLNKKYRKVLGKDEKPIEKEAKKDAEQLEKDSSVIEKVEKSTEKTPLPVDSNPKVIKIDYSLHKNDCTLLGKFEKSVENDSKQLAEDASQTEKDVKSTGKSSIPADLNPKLIRKDDSQNKSDFKRIGSCEKPIERDFAKDAKLEKDAPLIEKNATPAGKVSQSVNSNPKDIKVKDDTLSNDFKPVKTAEKSGEKDVKPSEKKTAVTTVSNVKIPKVVVVQKKCDAKKIPTDKAQADLVKADVKPAEEVTKASEKIVPKSAGDRKTRSNTQSDKDLSIENVKSPAIPSTLTLTDDGSKRKLSVAKPTMKLDKKLDDKIINSETKSASAEERRHIPNKRKSDRSSDVSEPEIKIPKSEGEPRLDKSGKNSKELRGESAVTGRKICRIDYKKDTNSTGPLKLEATISSEEITKIVQPKNVDTNLTELKSAVGDNEQGCSKVDLVVPKNLGTTTLEHAKSEDAEKRSIIDVITNETVKNVTEKQTSSGSANAAVREQQDETAKSVILTETKHLSQRTSNLVETLESDDSDNAFLVDIKLAKNKKSQSKITPNADTLTEIDEILPGQKTQHQAGDGKKELVAPVKNIANKDCIISSSSSDSDRSTTSDVVNPKPTSTSRIASKAKKFTKTRSLRRSDDQSFSDSDEEPLSKLTQNKPASKTVENKPTVAKVTKEQSPARTVEEPSPMTLQKSTAPEKPVLENEAKPKRECAKRPQYYLPMFSSSSSDDEAEFLTTGTKKIDFKSREAPAVTTQSQSTFPTSDIAQQRREQKSAAVPTSDLVQQKREQKSALPTSDVVQQKRDLATAARKFTAAKTSTTKSLESAKKFPEGLSQPASDLLLSSKDLGRRFGKGKVNMSNEQIEQWLKDSAMAGGSAGNSKSGDQEIFEEYTNKIPTQSSLGNTDLFEKIDTGHLKASLLSDSSPPGQARTIPATEELVKEKSSSGAQGKPAKSLQQLKLKSSDKSKTKISPANALTIDTIYSNIKDQMASPTSMGDSRKLIFRKDKSCAQVPNVNAFSAQNESSVYAFGDDNEDEVMKTPFRRISRRPSSTATSRSEDESCKIDETSAKPAGHFRKPLVKQQQSRTSGTEDPSHTEDNSLAESTTNQDTPVTENEDSNDQSNQFYTPTSAQQRIKSNLSKMASRLSSMLAPSSTVNLKSSHSLNRAGASSGDNVNKNSSFPSCSTTSAAAAKSGGRSAELLAEECGGTKYKIPSSPSASSSSSAKLYNSAAKRQKSTTTASGISCGSSKTKPIEILPVVLPDFPAGSSIAHVVEAPTFHPTDKEFQDPLEYIEKIRLRAEQFGVCRIVPPATFKPECKVTDDMRFTAYNQYVNKMLYRWGPNFKELMAIRKYLSTQNISLNQPPWIGGMEIDLPRLYQTVQMLGGLKEVIEKKKWPKVSDVMKIPKSAQDRVTKLDDIYCKYLLPYDTLSPAEREKLFDEVETEWAKRESKALLKMQQQNETEKKTNTESAQQDNNDSDTETSEIDESEECIVKGRNIALNAFYRIARNTMSMWFKNSEPPAQEVEQEFWKHVTLRQNHICVHSGSIDSGSWGYGFAVSKNSPFARHAWNLKVLTNNSGSVLRALGPMMGLTVPTLHVGMLFSSCCWYRDPHGLPWIEYLHTGGNKIWYAVPKSTGTVFNEALGKLVPNYCRNKPLWLPSDTVMVPPDLLTENGVSLSRIVQEPGQFVVVFPKVFTSSISTGYVVSESVYFAPSYWLSTARAVFEDLRNSCEPSMFSLDRLLLSIINDQRSSVDVLRQIIPAVQDICDAETRKRNTITEELGVTLSEKLPPPEAPKTKKKKKIQGMDGDYECEICRMSLFISMVLESQDDVVYCLDHAIELLQTNKIGSEHCKLLYTFDEQELGGLVSKINAAIENKLQKKVPNKYAGMPTLLNK